MNKTPLYLFFSAIFLGAVAIIWAVLAVSSQPDPNVEFLSQHGYESAQFESTARKTASKYNVKKNGKEFGVVVLDGRIYKEIGNNE